jgi:hypothetical protein
MTDFGLGNVFIGEATCNKGQVMMKARCAEAVHGRNLVDQQAGYALIPVF